MTTIVRYLQLVTVVGLLLLGYFIWQAYEGRQGLVASQRQACHDNVRDRSSDVAVRVTQAWATQQVADDQRQPAATRRARRIEAAQDRRSVRDRLTRIDAHAATRLYARVPQQTRGLLRSLDSGRRLDCDREHPAASLLP